MFAFFDVNKICNVRLGFSVTVHRSGVNSKVEMIMTTLHIIASYSFYFLRACFEFCKTTVREFLVPKHRY